MYPIASEIDTAKSTIAGIQTWANHISSRFGWTVLAHNRGDKDALDRYVAEFGRWGDAFAQKNGDVKDPDNQRDLSILGNTMTTLHDMMNYKFWERRPVDTNRQTRADNEASLQSFGESCPPDGLTFQALHRCYRCAFGMFAKIASKITNHSIVDAYYNDILKLTELIAQAAYATNGADRLEDLHIMATNLAVLARYANAWLVNDENRVYYSDNHNNEREGPRLHVSKPQAGPVSSSTNNANQNNTINKSTNAKNSRNSNK